MERTKILPRHLLLLFSPIIAAILGGLLFSGSFIEFTNNWDGRGISQAELYFALSFFIGSLAFGYSCLPKKALLGVQIFIPLLYGLLMLLRFKMELSLFLLFILNLVCGFLLWLILRYTFFSRTLIRVRTLIFSLVSALVLSVYFKLLMSLLKQAKGANTFMDYFLNALVLFIFIGVGISLAILIITRKEIREESKTAKEDEEDDDF
ncbi:MAG TPA: hypothetical protein PKO26_02640 [Candidatus Cloacimonas sp.]|jgi:hypothetical protein|nr:hypothetical protein [Candidatus Cloacimonas sp.]HNS84788.1 hypothetical protein [Candidatus Cloacimonas sp.]